MNNLEKILFLEMGAYQYDNLCCDNPEYVKTYKLCGDNPEYVKTYKLLNGSEIALWVKYSQEIHDIYSYINSGTVKNVKEIIVNNVYEYNEKICPISNIIMNLINNYNFTLIPEISEEFKNAYINMFGKSSFDKFINKTNM